MDGMMKHNLNFNWLKEFQLVEVVWVEQKHVKL